MRTHIYRIFLFTVGTLFAPYISGQICLTEMDSITISKPKIKENLYRFFDSVNKEIQFGPMKAESVPYKTNVKFYDFAKSVITTLAGFGSSSSTEVNWKISGNIKCNDALPDWTVSLFCEGFIREERVVVSDNGSRSAETNETNWYTWDKDAAGILTENYDTIGLFSIIMNPREDTLIKSYSSDIFPRLKDQNSGLKIKWSASWKPKDGADYAIIGRFREQDFIIIRNGTDRKAYIYLSNSLICLFQSGLDFPGIARKYRIMPYLLINKNVSEIDKRDLFRLAMVSCCISIALDSRN